MKRLLKLTLPVAVGALISGAAGAQTVGMATTSQGSYTNSAGSAIAKVVSEATDLRMRVQPFAGSSVYVPELNAGEIEMGLANVFETYLAHSGAELFRGRKHPDLRIASVLVPFRATIYVGQDSDIKSLRDLKGKRVPGGFTSQLILLPIFKAHLANAGLSYDDTRQVPVANVVQGANDFMAGKTDAFIFAMGAGKVREVAARMKIRVLPIDTSDAAVARMREQVPVSYVAHVTQAQTKIDPGFHEPTDVLGYAYLVIAGAKTSDDIVYKAVKAMHGNKKDLAASFRPLGGFQPDAMAQDFSKLGLQYHPGAIKFYKEIGAWPPKIDGLAAK